MIYKDKASFASTPPCSLDLYAMFIQDWASYGSRAIASSYVLVLRPGPRRRLLASSRVIFWSLLTVLIYFRCAWVHACVRACMRACACACVCLDMQCFCICVKCWKSILTNPASSAFWLDVHVPWSWYIHFRWKWTGERVNTQPVNWCLDVRVRSVICRCVTYTHTHTYKRMHAHKHTHTNAHLFMWCVCVRACMCVYVCVCSYCGCSRHWMEMVSRRE